ncbi:MAG: ABC transporter [Omnitrophica WOR_2 bacterium RIFCSPHIGHO2_02_FULL_52_10]|nr:MAG: ABC transporter [Omnitrophica WOR_2 bacterium RIFCSPHIGHO2_02_FULL_52_10]
MNKVLAIARKELATFFKSPMAYILLFLTISVFNIFFFIVIDSNQESTLKDIFKIMEFLFVFLIPMLTMKTFAEEKATGTMEFLMTTPTSNTAIVLGKYLGSIIFFTLIIMMTISYYVIIECFGTPDRAATLTGYFGVWLEGGLFIAIGLLISSLTRNQIIAAISTYVAIFLLYFSLSFIQYTQGTMEALVRHISTLSHMENFAVGLVTAADIVYYVSGIVFCLVLTRVSIENRLWR